MPRQGTTQESTDFIAQEEQGTLSGPDTTLSLTGSFRPRPRSVGTSGGTRRMYLFLWTGWSAKMSQVALLVFRFVSETGGGGEHWKLYPR